MSALKQRNLSTVTIDANNFSDTQPGWLLAGLEDVSGQVRVGDLVHAVQPAMPGDVTDFVGRATVRAVDVGRRLIYLEVEWDSFGDGRPLPSFRDVRVVVSTSGRTLRLSSSSVGPASRVRTGATRVRWVVPPALVPA